MTPLKVIATILSVPLLLALLLACVGLALLSCQRRRAGYKFIAGAGILSYLASISLVGNALLAPLESEYVAFDAASAIGVHDIVVLGSGYEPHDGIPVTGALDADGLARIVEGVRLARLLPGSRLLVSGGALPGSIPGAVGYARLAEDLGIDRSAMIVLDRAVNTVQETREVASLLENSRFVLVTSAYHMPRSMRLMRLAGANPIAAPVGQLLRTRTGWQQFGLIPGASGLHKTETALHEYLGLAAICLHVDH
jgi:uncharacterized SAM-binding protein YcdF (DUF218 family)